MTKNNKRLIIFFIFVFIFGIINLKLKIPCLFKQIFKIPCPTCGLTRAIQELLNFNILKSISYNILIIPITIILAITYVLIFVDIIRKSNYLENFWLKITKHYKIIILLLIISFIINNLKNN